MQAGDLEGRLLQMSSLPGPRSYELPVETKTRHRSLPWRVGYEQWSTYFDLYFKYLSIWLRLGMRDP